jgi:hypothetical protein
MRRHYGAERVIAVLHKPKGEELVRVCVDKMLYINSTIDLCVSPSNTVVGR